ncbi:ABC transporter ATP-binding protein [Mycoplasma sp. P36-A1]|uniref:ABC transporter ATP-binding protein n=1 Tax=Mycoplasma sp. P36-A1 TaxID=3252900 RepID=UPI003C2F42F8
MINVVDVTKLYGQELALDNISLEVEDGEFVAIMGPSGSGKSTLLNLMSGIDQATSGSIIFDGRPYEKIKNNEMEKIRQQQMGFIFQEYNVLNSLNVRENIALPLTIQKVKKKEIQQRVEKIATELEIEKYLDKLPYQLSGGQRQRVAIARALIINPKIVFADEPTGALDSKNAHRFLSNLEQQNQTKGITTMLVTHDPFSASFASRVVFIKDGKIFHSLSKGALSRKGFYEQIIKVSMMLGGDFDVD